jgi:hypothetical protein
LSLRVPSASITLNNFQQIRKKYQQDSAKNIFVLSQSPVVLLAGRKRMIAGRPVVSFDTTVHNRTFKDGATQSDAVLAGLKSGYFVRSTGLALEELVGTPDSSMRSGLLATAGRFQSGPGDCLLPQNELLRLLILAHHTAPDRFDWKAVNVSTSEYARAFSDRAFVDDALSTEQRNHLNQAKKEFEAPFSALRPKLEEIFERHGEAPPLTFKEVLPRIQGEGGLVWVFGKRLYDQAAGTDVSEATIRQFMEVCPPFRAVVYAFLLAWYDRSLRDRHLAEKFRAGRINLFMAIYLPYCDQFITAEIYGEQEKCLREVVSAAELTTMVRSYDDFCNSMLIPAA